MASLQKLWFQAAFLIGQFYDYTIKFPYNINQKCRGYKVDKILKYKTRKRCIGLNLEISGWKIGRDCH